MCLLSRKKLLVTHSSACTSKVLSSIDKVALVSKFLGGARISVGGGTSVESFVRTGRGRLDIVGILCEVFR